MSKQVVADGDYAMVPDLMTLFDYYGGKAVENNSEIIFDVQNIRASGLGGRISSHVAPNATAPALGASTNGSFEAESTYFASFNAADKRRDATFLLSWNKNGTIVNYVANNAASS